MAAHSFIAAQDLPNATKQQLENLADVTEQETEDDAYLQQLSYLQKDPMNLNTATADELQVFFFLTDLQIQNLIQYRNLLGDLISIYELQSVPGWDLNTIYKIIPYISVGNRILLKEDLLSRFRQGEKSLLLRASRIIENSKGYDQTLSTHYGKDKNQLLLRYRYQYKNLLQYGFSADKDAGEPFFKSINTKGFDFYSFHLFARNVGIFKSIAIGDYTVNLGQGLIQWQSLAFKKSTEVLAIKRQSAVLKPYTSAGEFYFNRGIAATIQKGNIQATFFGSFRNISANRSMDSLGNEIFTSFLTSGYHRTSSEQVDKNSVHQTSFGGNVSYRQKTIYIGLNGVGHQFSIPLEKRHEPYNLYALGGRKWGNISVDYSFTHKNFHFFGEAAADKNFNKATVNGLLMSVTSKIDVSLLHRYISKDYQALYGNAFTENTLPNNERGFYAGMNIKPFPAISLQLYSDLYKFPWLKYRTDAPSEGKDFMAQLIYEPDKKIEIYTRYRYESKQINETQDGFTNYVVDKPRQNWRVHFSYILSPQFTFRSRVDMLWYDKEGKSKEEGFLFFTEGIYKAASSLTANLRLQYFETNGYNSRLYAYENDVLYSYSVPAFFDKGFRYYCNINYDVGKKFSVWVRWAQTLYKNKETVGSGLDEINGNRRSQVKLQVIYRY